eukprot:TRINITY_DN2713_c0_g1_i2.p1 TRINITY_DN2713_c0_g1~~TRINITY_DN2713_c0_g1_i2.p1  ORF type:complete len:344 (-),score=62.54 TRINITY_DN2713_c0_g1_i2:254-1285(-)
MDRRGEKVWREIAAEIAPLDSGRWQVNSYIGSGSYGEVCGATDAKTGRRVAIKRVHTCLQHGKRKNILDDTFLAKRVLREVMLFSHFHHHNILELHAIVRPGPKLVDKMFLVTDLMDTDLQSIIRSGQPLSEDHISFFMFQVFLALKALHDAHVMHRDLHPANVLLSLDNDVKLCDFNLCREEAPPESDTELTDYVTSRWYRAPELVMQWRHYTRAVDLWSAGCLLAELYRGSPLFRGSTFYQQLDAIVHVVGRPSSEEIDEIGTPAARKYLFMNPDFTNLRLRPLKDHVPNASPAALDLLSKLLQFVPSKRITVDEALRHPFFQGPCTAMLCVPMCALGCHL